MLIKPKSLRVIRSTMLKKIKMMYRPKTLLHPKKLKKLPRRLRRVSNLLKRKMPVFLICFLSVRRLLVEKLLSKKLEKQRQRKKKK